MQLFFRIPVANENFYLMKINTFVYLCLLIKNGNNYIQGIVCSFYFINLIFYNDSRSVSYSPKIFEYINFQQ